MTTIAFEPGAADPVPLRLEDDVGTPIDTSGWQMELRVHLSAGCVVVPTARDTDGQFVIDANAITLPPHGRAYRAVMYVDRGEGWRLLVGSDGEPSDIRLRILEVC